MKGLVTLIGFTMWAYGIYVTLVTLNHVDAWPFNGWLGD